MPLFGNKQQEADTVKVLGKPYVCPVCQHDRFYQGKALLNTRGLTLFKLDWANRGATHLTCERCGHITWFNQ